MIKIVDNPRPPINRAARNWNKYANAVMARNPITIWNPKEYNAPWLTLSKCCQAKTHYGLGGHVCDKCKKDCDVIGYSDIIASTKIQQKKHTAEYSKRKDEDKMALKIVAMEERKMPRSKVGKFTGLDDIKEAFVQLAKLPAGKAVEITLDNTVVSNFKKDGTEDPARSIVNMLKRKFTNDGLSFKAYASDERTITILKVAGKKG